MAEELSKEAPGSLALIQSLVNTQYGQGKHAHTELNYPDELRAWLVTHYLLADSIPVTEEDFRSLIQLREALRSLLRANNESELPASQVEVLNQLARQAPLILHFGHDGLAILEPDSTGINGVLTQLLGIMFTAMKDGTWDRLKSCRNDRCQKAFYDISKNHSGAWCSMATCGSRMKAHAYRHRREMRTP